MCGDVITSCEETSSFFVCGDVITSYEEASSWYDDYQYTGNISSRFSSNSEATVSELRENLEDMFIVIRYSFISSTTQDVLVDATTHSTVYIVQMKRVQEFLIHSL